MTTSTIGNMSKIGRTLAVRAATVFVALAAGSGAQALTIMPSDGALDSTRAPAAPLQLAQVQEGPGNQNPGGPGEEGRRRRGPPPEAIAACQGKASGAPCSFTNHRNETRTGTCFAPPPPSSAGGNAEPLPLACRPARPEGGRPPG
jgi:hypothetical protein